MVEHRDRTARAGHSEHDPPVAGQQIHRFATRRLGTLGGHAIRAAQATGAPTPCAQDDLIAVDRSADFDPTTFRYVAGSECLSTGDEPVAVPAAPVGLDTASDPHEPDGDQGRAHYVDGFAHGSQCRTVGHVDGSAVVVARWFVPEILEVEMFRRAASLVIGRTVKSVTATDRIVVPEPAVVRSLEGRRITDVTRRGKMMTIHAGPARDPLAVDVHFGMSGRIIVDGSSPIGELAYGASDDAKWIRFALHFGKGEMLLSDPRRFARVQPSSAWAGLGPDAFDVTKRDFVDRVGARKAPLKAVLLDQSVLAGLGNMLVDEILLRAELDPRRPVNTVSPADLGKVHTMMRRVLPELARKGGSHAGRLSAELRYPGAACPLDGQPMRKCVVGGRTTFFCPVHQR